MDSSNELNKNNQDSIFNTSNIITDQYGNKINVWDFDKYQLFEYNNSNIFVIENIFENKLCDSFINLIDKLKLNKHLYSDNNNVECLSTNMNELLLENEDLYYEFYTDTVKYNELLNNINDKNISIYNNNINGLKIHQIKAFINAFSNKTKIISEIMEKVNNHISFEYNVGMILRKIFGKTRLHTDGVLIDKSFNKTHFIENRENNKINMNTIIARNASAIFTLNDDYNGGEFKFPHYNVTIKLKKGSVLIFPPYWTHYHETNELLDDTYRYTITTWYGKVLGQNTYL